MSLAVVSAAGAQTLPTTTSSSLLPATFRIEVQSTEAAPQEWPLLAVNLLVTNRGGQAIDRLEFRPTLGGPTVRLPAIIPPNTQAKLRVALPAVSPHEGYSAAWPGHGGEFRTDLTILWPPERIDEVRSGVIDPDAYRPYDTRLPQWPSAARRGALIVLVLAVLAGGGILWVRRTSIRLAAGGVILAAASVGMWMILSAVPVVEDLSQTHPAPRADERQVVLAARRHAPGTVEGNYYGLYRNLAQMRRDASVMEPGRISLELRPGESRIFRPKGKPDRLNGRARINGVISAAEIRNSKP